MEVANIFLRKILFLGISQQASKIIFAADNFPALAVGRKIEILDQELFLTPEMIHGLIVFLLGGLENKKENSIFIKELFGQRYKIEISSDKHSPGIIFTLIPFLIPEAEKWLEKDDIEKLLSIKTGLILLCSQTRDDGAEITAAIIEKINQTKAMSIITLESSIDYIIKSKKCRIKQSQIGKDFKTVREGLKEIKTHYDMVFIIESGGKFSSGLPIILELASGSAIVVIDKINQNANYAIEKIAIAAGKTMSRRAANHALADILQAVIYPVKKDDHKKYSIDFINNSQKKKMRQGEFSHIFA